mmetsp:Transcript_36349/g.73268  ORF Transcript_36349/g.73268 Transcript_36349/m.73268 type:complete len:240 (+) Transcript_36349:721-1440(+)
MPRSVASSRRSRSWRQRGRAASGSSSEGSWREPGLRIQLTRRGLVPLQRPPKRGRPPAPPPAPRGAAAERSVRAPPPRAPPRHPPAPPPPGSPRPPPPCCPNRRPCAPGRCLASLAMGNRSTRTPAGCRLRAPLSATSASRRRGPRGPRSAGPEGWPSCRRSSAAPAPPGPCMARRPPREEPHAPAASRRGWRHPCCFRPAVPGTSRRRWRTPHCARPLCTSCRATGNNTTKHSRSRPS